MNTIKKNKIIQQTDKPNLISLIHLNTLKAGLGLFYKQILSLAASTQEWQPVL